MRILVYLDENGDKSIVMSDKICNIKKSEEFPGKHNIVLENGTHVICSDNIEKIILELKTLK